MFHALIINSRSAQKDMCCSHRHNVIPNTFVDKITTKLKRHLAVTRFSWPSEEAAHGFTKGASKNFRRRKKLMDTIPLAPIVNNQIAVKSIAYNSSAGNKSAPLFLICSCRFSLQSYPRNSPLVTFFLSSTRPILISALVPTLIFITFCGLQLQSVGLDKYLQDILPLHT